MWKIHDMIKRHLATTHMVNISYNLFQFLIPLPKIVSTSIPIHAFFLPITTTFEGHYPYFCT